MSFAEDYARYGKPSQEREDFVYKTITSLPRQQVVGTLKPVTVTKPDGTKVTYNVMPDYIQVDGVRVPMAGNTAQKVADYFGMNLPTPKMVDEIYRNADVQVSAAPLSGSGATIGDRHYSPDDVVRNYGVGYGPFAVAYNNKVNNQLQEQGAKPGQIVAGFCKDIVPPEAPGKLGLYGFYQKGNPKPIQSSAHTPHDTSVHSEYGSFVRLVSPTVSVTHPDGKTEEKPLGEVYQYARYFPNPKDRSETGPGNETIEKIDQVLNQVQTQIAARISIYQRLMKYAEKPQVQIMSSVGKDPAIKDLSQASIPGHAPEGFQPISQGESDGGSASAIGYAARQILENSSLGDQVPFKIGDQLYMGRSEPHYHPPPPDQTNYDPAKYPKPWGWHRGVTVFKAKEGTQTPTTSPEQSQGEATSGSKGRISLIQRIDNFLGGLGKELG